MDPNLVPASATTTPSVYLASNSGSGARPSSGSRAGNGLRDAMMPPPPLFGEDALEGDHANELLQPAISPLATRLASPLTPRAEKVAILGGPPNGTVESTLRAGTGPGTGGAESDVDSDDAAEPIPSYPPTPRNATADEVAARSGFAGPKPAEGYAAEEVKSPRAMYYSVFGGSGQQRHRRSTTVGVEALKRFQKAFPSFSSMQLPSGLRQSLASGLLSGFNDKMTADGNQQPPSSPENPPIWRQRPMAGISADDSVTPGPPYSLSAQSSAPSRPKALRRVTSDDSLLYHTMSRTSFDDESRFDHIRSMASVRMMAIRESLPERPSFKMPSLPSLPSLPKLSAPLKRSALDATSATVPSMASSPRSASLPRAASASSLESETPTAPLDHVLETLGGDIVVLGGYRGSVLRDASPPHQQLWAPVKLGLNMRKVDLEIGLDPADEETAAQRIIPSGMLQKIGPIDISRKLLRRMRACENAKAGVLRVWDYGYDWRLSPALLSKRLEEYMERLPCNQTDGETPRPRGAWVIAHSLGGMLTRRVVNRRPELFAGVVYVGVPQRCVNILGPIRNGDAVLLNEKILTARVNFSLRTSFAFLPEDGFCFVDRDSGEDLRIDFYDVEDWKRYRLSPCIEAPLPALSKPSLGSLLPSLPTLPTIPIHLRRREKATTTLPSLSTSNSMTPPDIATGGRAAPSPQTAPSPAPSLASLASPQTPTDTSNSPIGPSSPTRDEYVAYLTRTLAGIKKFRSELAFRPKLADANAYPPLALMYGRDVPTVYAARVAGRDAICRADAYDDLLFRGGDGVVLAREAMLPEGYSLVKGGKVLTERGHVTMLGDLAGLGRALGAVVRGRRKGVGLGAERGGLVRGDGA